MKVSDHYLSRKKFFEGMLTIYGRKPVLEALQDSSLNIYKLHVAQSNRPGGILEQIHALAASRQIPMAVHSREALSRISRNGRQDQGVAADIELDSYRSFEQFLTEQSGREPQRLIALDRITNPQNLGLIIRSVCAGRVDGLILPRKGCAVLSPMVIKASAGTLFRTPLLHCDDLRRALKLLQSRGSVICTLSSHATTSLFDFTCDQSIVYVLGNETDGVSAEIDRLADRRLCIPMNNGVESLNVAITAALIAFYGA